MAQASCVPTPNRALITGAISRTSTGRALAVQAEFIAARAVRVARQIALCPSVGQSEYRASDLISCVADTLRPIAQPVPLPGRRT